MILDAALERPQKLGPASPPAAAGAFERLVIELVHRETRLTHATDPHSDPSIMSRRFRRTTAWTPTSEHEVVDTVEQVDKCLTAAGYGSEGRLGITRDASALIAGVRRAKPDVVFNLFEGLAGLGRHRGVCRRRARVARRAIHRLPAAGRSALARSKPLTKQVLRGSPPADTGLLCHQSLAGPGLFARLASNREAVQPGRQRRRRSGERRHQPRGAGEADRLPLRRIRTADPGRRVHPGARVQRRRRRDPELTVFPPTEIQFISDDPGFWPIVTYDAKWKPGTVEYEATPPVYVPEIAPRLLARLERLAKQAYRLLGCRDYARVDFRVKPPAKPYILEVNPNPDLSPQAGMSAALAAAGMTWEAFVLQIVQQALARGKSSASTETRGTKPGVLSRA